MLGSRLDPSAASRFLRGQPGAKARWKVWLGIAVVLWALYTAMAGPQGIVRLIEVRADQHQLEGEIAGLKARLDSLKTLQATVGTDPFVREKIARQRYEMARDDELIYYLTPKASKGADWTPIPALRGVDPWAVPGDENRDQAPAWNEPAPGDE